MKYDPDIHYRKSIRLKGYDYSQSGAYFVTICTHNRKTILVDDDIQAMITTIWQKLPKKFGYVSIDAFTVMPNHIHGIIFLNDPNFDNFIPHQNPISQNIITPVGADPCVCPKTPGNGKKKKLGEHTGSPLRTLGDIVRWFKTMTTNKYLRGIHENGWKSFERKLWQRNYYEHVIRNETDLNQIREYIVNNSLQWELDKDNPKNWNLDV